MKDVSLAYLAIFTISISATIAATIIPRATPTFDIFLHMEEECEDEGELCRGLTAGVCCTYAKTPPGMPLFASTSYREAGQSERSSLWQAQLFSALGLPDQNWRPCGVRITQDDTCATGGILAGAGAMVAEVGSDTVVGRASDSLEVMYTTDYFYRSGLSLWTLPIDSEAGRAYRAVPKEQKHMYIIEHGSLTIKTEA